MRFPTRKLLSLFLAINLIWVFVGCAFLCSEIGDCAGDFASDTSVITQDYESDDSCPLDEAVKITVTERFAVEFNSIILNNGIFQMFLVNPSARKSTEYQSRFYRPPNINPPQNRLTILRI